MTRTEQKRRYRGYQARIAALPPAHRAAAAGLEQYVEVFGPRSAEALLPALEDIAALFERAAADGIPVSQVTGGSPVRFAEEFLASYPQGSRTGRNRDLLAYVLGSAIAATAPSAAR